MKEILTSNQLKGYLGTDLKGSDSLGETVTLSGIKGNTYFIEESKNTYAYADIMDFKPYLKPLSDLTKHCEDLGFVPIERLKDIFNCDVKDFDIDERLNLYIYNRFEFFNVSFSDLQEMFKKLYEWKFDIHGLIDNGLAIDINTIEL